MTGQNTSDRRADQVAAWATGVGIGVAVFMLTWLVANRVTDLLWAPPIAPIVAITVATVTGIVTSIRQGWRLSSHQVTAPRG